MIDVLLDQLLVQILNEDLASGDLTTEACVDEAQRCEARAVARADLVVCGAAVFGRVFRLVDPTLDVELEVPDGRRVSRGDHLWRVAGSARSILMAERTALNLVQRMSGTATLTRRFVDALPQGSTTRIVDTRKTTPLLRSLERYAVRVGGGANHRDNLGSAVMIKDNHIVAAGGVTRAIERARQRAPHTSRIEVEVADLAMLDEALAARADIIMLDNFDTDLVREAMPRVHATSPRPTVESSGRLTLDRVRELAELGVDILSVGALTHSAPAADIALELALLPTNISA